MNSKDPFLVLPDYRGNLKLDLIPGMRPGAVVDYSGNSHVIAIEGTPVRKDGGLFPVLDMTDDGRLKVTHAADLLIGTTTQTILMWCKVATASAYNGVLNKGSDMHFGPCVTSGKRSLSGYFMDNDENNEFELYQSSAHLWSVGEWFMCGFVFDNAVVAVKAYINGAFSFSKNRNGTGYTYTNTNSLYIGKDTNSLAFDGDIAMVRVYAEALTAEKIKQIYQYTRRHVMGMSPKL